MSKSLISHWLLVKRILRYLNSTIHYGLALQPASQVQLYGFTNTNWGSNLNDRHSIIEAKFSTLVDTTSEMVRLHSLLIELKIFLPNPPFI